MFGNTEFENGGDPITLKGCLLFYDGFSIIDIIILTRRNFNKMVITDQILGPLQNLALNLSVVLMATVYYYFR